MRDLTTGPVRAHILQLSAFIALTTFFQTLYFLVDLYFVGRLGKEAIAGVGLAGNLTMIVLALTQSLGVGATAMIAQALGRRQKDDAERVFNQAVVMSLIVGLMFGVVAFTLRRTYAESIAADAPTAAYGVAYLNWFVPALVMQFGLVAMGAALRGLGDLKVPTIIQIATVFLNIALAPVLMFGWGTGHAFGVAGAALASFIAIVAGCVAFVLYFMRAKSHMRFRPADWPPNLRLWWHMLRVGLPVGGEFALLSFYLIFVYSLIRPFGAAAQAGFGIGVRVMQSLFLPSVAIGFATAPVTGQNVGARLGARVRETFYSAAGMSAIVMAVFTILCQVASGAMIRIFNTDPGVIAVGSGYLRIISWNFVASGIVFVASSVFQGLGNTVPALATSALRLTLFVVSALALSRSAGFHINQLWYVSLVTVFIQAVLSVWLLHREFDRRLPA